MAKKLKPQMQRERIMYQLSGVTPYATRANRDSERTHNVWRRRIGRDPSKTQRVRWLRQDRSWVKDNHNNVLRLLGLKGR